MTESWTSALSLPSFAPPRTAKDEQVPTDKRGDIQDVAMRWQSHSAGGAMAGWASLELLQRSGRTGYGPLLNRVVEIHGLAGSIGEQVSLAWAAEQDAQRFRSPLSARHPQNAETTEFAYRMAARALCEMSTHFLLGAAHSLANLVLRVVLCDAAAAATVNGVNDKAKGFQPGSNEKAAWPTFGPQSKLWSQTLPKAAARSGLEPLRTLTDRVTQLQQDARFSALEDRRGMDYHRHRPQSLDHTSPRSGIWSQEGTTSHIAIPSAQPDPRRDEEDVHSICLDALHCIADVLRETEPLIASALDSCHLAWRGAAGR
ncbi:hypothetical protein [Streptomyces sp. NPDC003273]|uniref:hypothetical protein n=1 Tax=Streptomyces sp. NPDC003273 TaxID=3364678 RepID=UPI00369EFABE